MPASLNRFSKLFARYFLGSVILLQILPFAFIAISTVLSGGELGLLPPYIFRSTIPELAGDYLDFGILSLILALFHSAIRTILSRSPSPFQTRFLPLLEMLQENRAGRILLYWILPFLLSFIITRYFFIAFERHIERGIVGCWNTGFPFTYEAGCSTPPIKTPGIPPQEDHRVFNPAYYWNLEVYFGIALFATVYFNFLGIAKNRFTRLSARYFAAIALVVTILPPWVRGYNEGLLLVGAPWNFLTHYYLRTDGDVYKFIGKSFGADILICLALALLIASIHPLIRMKSRTDPTSISR